ncbi:hypothetical protein TUSST3_08820 [Streptomyces sp. TUS-ST3]|uniref:hypothetical protein n=1 Tax=Streptomyces sp. TUS-ST3 TaxID=3025591 RepID=UPI0024E0BEA9|nr:hypothetical protein [Streptomyces sp. TUS-ST3]GLP64262.1 hypothetical protein TUSST3_08820 [Streptomyces sp. TUS-ST3]
MTADAYLVVRCDGPDATDAGLDGECVAEGTWPIRHDPYTHRELRRLLKQHRGWRRTRDGRDLCPNHPA